MNNSYKKSEVPTHLKNKVVKRINDYKLCAYLISFEGWRRGLHLKWYHTQYSDDNLFKMNEKTGGKNFSLEDSNSKHFFFRSRGDKVSNDAVKFCFNKSKTKKQLEYNGIKTPEGKIFNIYKDERMINYAKKIGFPVVLKPVDGSMGRGVFVNIKDVSSLKADINQFRKNFKYKNCIIEKYYPGKDYRFYVVDNKVISVIYRIPANVTGDGKKNIKELINQKNEHRKYNPYLANKPIKVDYEIKNILAEKHLTLKSVPRLNENIILRETGNLSLGGDSIDCTKEISNEVKALAVGALKSIKDIPHAGVDIIIDPSDNTKGVVLEINGTAEIGLHSFPMYGEVNDVPSAIVDLYFPNSIDNNKSQFYFDYFSLLPLLNNHTIDYVQVMDAPIGDVYAKKYKLIGKVQNVGLLNWIKKEALKEKVYGYGYNVDNEKSVLYLYSTQKEVLESFVEKCKQGSKKSNITEVSYFDLQSSGENIFPIGFEIKRKK